MEPNPPKREPALSPVVAAALGALAALVVVAVVLVVVRPFGAPPAAAGAPGGAPGGGGPPGGGFPAAPVEVVAAVETIAAEPVEVLGSAAPHRDSLVASEVEGLVVAVEVDTGDSVREGAVLARLRTTTLEQQLAAARALQDETQARLERAEADFERLARLVERGAASRRDYDAAVAEREALIQGRARAQTEVVRLTDMLERATIRAPFAGQVTAVEVEVGEWVGQGDEVLTLVDLSQIEVTVQVPERYVPAVVRGFPVTVRLDAIPGRDYQGTVDAIVPQAVAAARTFPVIIRVANPDGVIKGGMAARVMAQLGSDRPAVLVSKDALVRRGAEVHVFRVNRDAGNSGEESTGGTLEQIRVRAGAARGDWQIVDGPVAGGDWLVVRGNERAFPGQPVSVARVLEPPVPEASSDAPVALDPTRQGR